MNGNTARIYEFPNENICKTELKIVSNKKLRKDGQPKRTHSNHTYEDRFVDPIRNEEDINKLSDYFQMQIDIAKTPAKKRIAARNKMLFILGINFGLRVSDLVPDNKDDGKEKSGLKWKHIFEPDMMTFRCKAGKKEKKTGKQRNLYLNEKMRGVVSDYIRIANPEIHPEWYVFTSSYKNPDGTPKPITDECISQIIKKAVAACEIKGHYNTHTFRKTFAYQYYLLLIKQGMHPLMAMGKVQKMLNHSSQLTTLAYFGLLQDEEIEISEMLNLG